MLQWWLQSQRMSCWKRNWEFIDNHKQVGVSRDLGDVVQNSSQQKMHGGLCNPVRVSESITETCSEARSGGSGSACMHQIHGSRTDGSGGSRRFGTGREVRIETECTARRCSIETLSNMVRRLAHGQLLFNMCINLHSDDRRGWSLFRESSLAWVK